jgi:hypothetical protein
MENGSNTTQRGRLIVLVPDGVADNLELARKIHWMAMRDRQEVLYIAFADKEDKVLSITRGLATIKAITSNNWLVVHSMIVPANHWLQSLLDLYSPGDTIVCHAGQVVRAGYFRKIPLEQYLRSAHGATVICLEGFYNLQKVPVNHWLAGLLFWVGLLMILFVFGLLEFQIDLVVAGSVRTLMFLVIVLLEFWLVWAWNNYTNR